MQSQYEVYQFFLVTFYFKINMTVLLIFLVINE